jgi:hypothetical protein
LNQTDPEVQISEKEKADLKLTYQSNLQKRGETPPPRVGDNKKQNESVYTKALAKNSGTIKGKPESSLSTNYFQNMFPTTLMQLNSLTPSAPSMTQQLDKKAGSSSTKATSSSTYNFGPYKTQMTIPRPQSSHAAISESKQATNSIIDSVIKQNGSFLNSYTSSSNNSSNQNSAIRTQLTTIPNTTINAPKQGPVK